MVWQIRLVYQQARLNSTITTDILTKKLLQPSFEFFVYKLEMLEIYTT